MSIEITEAPKQYGRWIIWGWALFSGPQAYVFDTQAELDAFLFGCEEANGWMEYAVFETKEEAINHMKERGAYEQEGAET